MTVFFEHYSFDLLLFFRDIDKVDELMQDITEQQELAQEISDAISKPVGFGEEFDEVPWIPLVPTK